MIKLSTLSKSLVLATTVLSAPISLVHAMDNVEENAANYQRIPAHRMTQTEQDLINSLKMFKVDTYPQQNQSEDPNSKFTLRIFQSGTEMPMAAPESIKTINLLIHSYMNLRNDLKASGFFAAEATANDGKVFFSKRENSPEGNLIPMDSEEAQRKLNAMLILCKKAVSQEAIEIQKQEENVTEATPIIQEATHESEKAVARSFEEEKAALEAERAQILKQQQDQELARLKTQIATTKAAAEQEAAVAQEAFRRQQEAAAAELVRIRQQQEIARLKHEQEMVKLRQETAAAEAQRQAAQAEIIKQRDAAAAKQRDTAEAKQRETAAAKQRETAAAKQRETAAAKQRETAAAKQRETPKTKVEKAVKKANKEKKRFEKHLNKGKF